MRPDGSKIGLILAIFEQFFSIISGLSQKLKKSSCMAPIHFHIDPVKKKMSQKDPPFLRPINLKKQKFSWSNLICLYLEIFIYKGIPFFLQIRIQLWILNDLGYIRNNVLMFMTLKMQILARKVVKFVGMSP